MPFSRLVSISSSVLAVVRRVQQASARGYAQALDAVVEGARGLLGDVATGVACVGLEDDELVRGDAVIATDTSHPAERLRAEARLAAWRNESLVFSSVSAEELALGSAAAIPICAHLPGGDGGPPFPVAMLLVEKGIAPPPLALESLSEVSQLAGLVGETLLICHDGLGGPDSRHGMISAAAFRRLTQRWVIAARQRTTPLSILMLAVEGIAEINEMLGFDAGDGALDDAASLIARELPADVAISRVGGAATAVLMVGTGSDRAAETGTRLAKAFSAHRPPSETPMSLSIGVATLDDTMRDGVALIRAGRTALQIARGNQGSLATWTPAMAAEIAGDPLPDIDSVSGAEYQRILAIWRLFETLSHGPQLDQLIAGTLRAVMPLFRADSVALWELSDGEWQPRTTIDRPGLDGTTSGERRALPEVVSLVERSTASRDAVTIGSAQGAQTVAIALRRGDDVTGVLELSKEGGVLRAQQSDLAFLRTLANQIGRVVGELSALGDARRRQQETADRLRRQTLELRRLLRTSSGLIGGHESMQAVFRMIERSRASNVPVIITGETGTGKEAVARLIHRQSGRRAPFVVVDCGAIPGTLLESELFGHEKGAFTGADARKIGRFEEAHKGTIFLDEIGELPLELQPKLLRVLQESTLRRIGGRDEIAVDFRLIAATNRDLEAMVEAGTFRRDLFFRLRVLEIKLPALRDRGDDVLLLALHALRQYCAELGCEMMSLSPEAEAEMRAYSWPGNVRELQNVLRRALLVAPGPELTPRDLQLAAQPGPPRPQPAAPPRPQPAAPPALAGSRSRPRTVPPVTDVRPAPAAALVQAPEPVGGNGRSGDLAETVAGWFWDAWVPHAAESPPPQEAIEAFLLRTALRVANGSLAEAATIMGMHPETFGTHLERLGAPMLSKTIRGHALEQVLEKQLREGGDSALRDRVLRILLTELLVYCRGNKSEMARNLGWGRQTLNRQLRRLEG